LVRFLHRCAAASAGCDAWLRKKKGCVVTVAQSKENELWVLKSYQKSVCVLVFSCRVINNSKLEIFVFVRVLQCCDDEAANGMQAIRSWRKAQGADRGALNG